MGTLRGAAETGRGTGRRVGILREPSFRRFWVGQTLSVFGSSISGFALPMTAILVLKGNAVQMGLLQAVSNAPYLLAAMPIGVVVDRVSRRRLMVGMDVGRTLLVAAVPALAILHRLGIGALYAITACLGVLTVGFDTAYEAFVPELAGRDRLVTANTSMQLSQSIAAIGGPGAAGLLVSLLTAPITLLVDAASFVVSAVSLASIPEPRRAPVAAVGGGVVPDMARGLAFLLGHQVLRPLVVAGAGIAGFFSAFLAVYFLYLIRQLGLSPAEVGFLLSAGAVGAAVSAVVTPAATSRLGTGPTVVVCNGLFTVAAWMVPLAVGPRWLTLGVLTIAAVLAFGSGYTGAVTSNTLRQAETPDPLLGRTAAANQTLSGTLNAVGALVGGLLGATLGLRGALLVACAGMSAMALWSGLSPVRRARGGMAGVQMGAP